MGSNKLQVSNKITEIICSFCQQVTDYLLNTETEYK